ncbi:MAG TPA: hypothetical protein VGA42_01175 [Gemmatimonadales bacterium]
MACDALRVAIFTHDTFGLGHVRRCLHITRALTARAPDSSVLLVTGSPALAMFAELPAHADVVKIPTIAKTGAKGMRPPHVRIPLPELVALRQRLIREALLGFAPDVFLVDNFPLGSQGELAPILQELRRVPTRTVLGLRDILDAPDAVRADWERQGVYDVLDRYYDRILVYGMREVLDIGSAYALSPGVAAKVRYCGYVTDDYSPPPDRDAIRAELGLPERFLLATGGGGGDAFPLLKAFLDALLLLPEYPAIVVTGPLMNGSQRATLQTLLNGRTGVQLLASVPSLRPYLATAGAVVSMCGYNTVAEIVSLGASAVVVPRTWRYGEHLKGRAAGEEAEQLMRGQALASLGLVDLVMPEELTPERLAEGIRARVSQGRRTEPPPVDLGGLAAVADHLLEIARARREGIHVAA